MTPHYTIIIKKKSIRIHYDACVCICAVTAWHAKRNNVVPHYMNIVNCIS